MSSSAWLCQARVFFGPRCGGFTGLIESPGAAYGIDEANAGER